MAMRRISWIDQRISDGVVVFLFLPGGSGRFFLALAHWRDVGWRPSWRRRVSPVTHDDAGEAVAKRSRAGVRNKARWL